MLKRRKLLELGIYATAGLTVTNIANANKMIAATDLVLPRNPQKDGFYF